MRPPLAAAALLVLSSAALAQDVLVVAPKDFEPALDAWKQHRARRGLVVEVKQPTDDLAKLVRETSEASGKKLKFVMLVGDVEQIPCATVPRSATGAMAGQDSDPNIATDAPFADLDGDGVPDLAIGRVPADTAAEAKSYLDRVVAYETSDDFGPWRTKLNVVAGTGGFGPFVDMAIEKLTRDLLSSLPASVDVSMTYANAFSPFCPPPAEFADYAVRRWNEGALVVAYVGHGSECNVDTCKFGKERYPILGLEQVEQIGAAHGAPVSIFVACSTGHIDGPRDCLAEEMLKRPGGPIAVIASSRVSSPYSNGILAKEMIDALYVEQAATTGELLVALKKRLLDTPTGDAMRTQIERMAEAMFEKSADIRRADRVDHLSLYNLLGDPCVRIARPVKMPVAAPKEIAQGAEVHFQFAADFDADLSLEVVRRKDPPPKVPAGRAKPEDFSSLYEAANRHVIAQMPAGVHVVKGGDVVAGLVIPADAPIGPAAVRVFLSGKSGCAAGAAEFTIVAPPTPPK